MTRLERLERGREDWHDRYIGALPTRHGSWYCQRMMARYARLIHKEKKMIESAPCPHCGQTVYGMEVHRCPAPERKPRPPWTPPSLPDRQSFTSSKPVPHLTLDLPGGARLQLVIPDGSPEDVRRELIAAFDRAVATFALVQGRPS